MKKISAVLFSFLLILGLAACGEVRESASPAAGSAENGMETANAETVSPEAAGTETSSIETEESGMQQSAGQQNTILIAYAPGEDGDMVERAAGLLAQEPGGDLFPLEEETDSPSEIEAGADRTGETGTQAETNTPDGPYEFIFLGFEAQNNALPEAVQNFLEDNDFGARTIIPFVSGTGNDSAGILEAVSLLQPGALLPDSVLLLSEDMEEQEITDWAMELGFFDETAAPESGAKNTVATAAVTPDAQQVLYLWEEGNMPGVTEYTENNGGYSDDPDFRPYLTSFPVPEGTEIKGAVLICAGGAFQFRSDENEGTPVAEALSGLGYQSFVVDYRLRPYTQQEGALDLARAVRFVRAHAQEYGIEEKDIAVMGFSAGGILSGEMLLNFDGQVNGTALDADYVPDALDEISADAAACGMIYSFYGRLSVGTTDVELLRSGSLPPTFYCYGTRDPFYNQFLANADAAEEAGVSVERLQLDGMPHGFGARGGWIPAYDEWLSGIFENN